MMDTWFWIQNFLIHSLPMIIVWSVGIIIAIVNFKKNKQLAIGSIIAFGGFILVRIINLIFEILLYTYLYDMFDYEVVTTVWYMFIRLLDIVFYCVLLVSMWKGVKKK